MLKRFRNWLLGSVAAVAAFFGWQQAMAVAQLTWRAPTHATDGSVLTDLAGFRVYRRAGMSNNDFVLLATITSPTQLSYTDSATYEGENCYHITAVDAAGNESDPSNVVCKTIDTIRPNAPTGLTVN
jgi:fibronectin type 3 domain-containing protein